MNGHADGGEDVQVVGLGRQEGLLAQVNRRELDTAGVDRLAPGPGVGLLGQTFVVLGRVGQGKDDGSRVAARHRLDAKVLRPEHPRLATALNNLASLYKRQGKYEQAEPLYQRALAIREQQLGPEHPTTVTIQEKYHALVRDMEQKGKG